jgi:hypothetical protein
MCTYEFSNTHLCLFVDERDAMLEDVGESNIEVLLEAARDADGGGGLADADVRFAVHQVTDERMGIGTQTFWRRRVAAIRQRARRR